jgi:signal transduction histidine kinase
LIRILPVICCLLFINPAFSQKDELSRVLDLLQQNTQTDSAKAELYTHLSYLYEAKNISSAIYYGTLAIQTARNANNQAASANAYNQQASNYVWNGQNDTALKLYFEAIRICNSNKYDELLMKSYVGIAYLYETMYELDKALDYSKKALEIAEQIDKAGLSAFAYHEMASVSASLNNYTEAFDYFTKAKAGFIKLNNLDRVASCCSDMSALYINRRQYTQAQQQLDSALQIFNTLDEPIQTAEVYEGYGHLYSEMKQFDQAAVNYDSAFAIYQNNQMGSDEARIETDKGNLLLAEKKYADAKNILLQAYDYFKATDNKEGRLQTIVMLAEADSALGNANKDFSYLTEYKSLSDSLTQLRTEQRTRELMVEIGAENKDKENEMLRAENNNNKNRSFLAVICGIIFLVIAIAIFLLYRQKLRANKEMRMAQEKTDTAYAEMKEMSNMKDKLFSILAHDLRSPLANTHHLLQLTKTGAIDSDIFSQLASELEINLDYNRELLDNVLNWAKSQMDGIIVNMKKLNLRKLVDENVLLFAAISEKKQVKIINNINTEDFVTADENIMLLALRNTISNAVKFSQPSRPVYISALTVESKTVITIKDEGVGISAEQQKNIFTVHTVSKRGTMQEKGAGIGLRITMEMIQKMGGRIWIESEEGNGTSVFIEVDTA